ncbi:intermembrane transport protein PqiB [Pseudothioclava nitratireducens]|uniref:PqiB family protein n=1 Tax=Pseudothioclava nitratireducens TaxID=1928646 RepID=UPI0023D9845C|nr:MlaD family protein [Defluviimonas nitratireducens]MDF1619873.1 MlaD family protein [Defluviimonas nitratireducens]
MNDTPQPAELHTTPAPPPIWSRVSVIWLVPLIALAVTLGVAWKSYSDRGVLIEIDFADATGIRPGETALKFREVEIGTVEAVSFSPDLTSVRVGVRVDKTIAPFIDDEAKFWLVRPEVSAQGISRLDTVLSGTFIEGFWDAAPTEQTYQFTGLDRAPVSPDPTKGTWVELRAEDAGGLAEGAPVIFRGITVGRLQNLRLSPAGGVLVDAFIDAPHDKRLSSQTRFWDTSGFSVSLGAGGVSLDVRSLASLVQGGVEFETFSTGGSTVQNGRPFRLFASVEAARNSIFGNDLVDPVRFTLLFDDAIEGIARGTKVHFRGVEAGEVTDISVRMQADSVGNQFARQQVVIALAPARLGLDESTEAEVVTEFLSGEVENGLRARIAGIGLLGTTRIIDLTDVPDQPEARVNPDLEPFPSIPTAPPAANELAASAEDVFERVQALPIEELMASAIRAMDSISVVAEDEKTRAVPGELAGLLEELRTLVDGLNAEGAAQKTISALDRVTSAADSVLTEIEGLGEMLASTDQAAQTFAELPMGEIGEKIDGILGDLRSMLGSEDAERLPRALSDTLEESAALLAELRAGGAAEKLNGTLDATQDAARAVGDATERLPELSRKLETLVSRAEGLVAAYGDRSAFNNEILTTIRELRRATSSFGSLARMIERNPRAFILGR